MTLRIGIVGLPNVGKSTLFNALTKEQNAEAANYPFCTIEPNKAVVAVPDDRVDNLMTLMNSEKPIYATIEFVDVAGLVKGASQGEGLGNKFLGNIRDTDAILHVVRAFDDENVVHVSAKPDPADDMEVINTELILADLQQVERKIEKLAKQIRLDKDLGPLLDEAKRVQEHLGGEPLWTYPGLKSEVFLTLNQEMRFLTAKPIIYVANVDEDSLDSGNEYVEAAREVAKKQGAELIVLCAKLEQEMAGLPDDELHEYMELAGIAEYGLEKVIRKGYELLGLASYFTFNEKEVHAWTIQRGWQAPQAAGVIHTDLEQGFIRAEVIPYEAMMEHKTRAAAKAAGAMRTEGRDYTVQDGDTIIFLHSN